jgi:hypothetical protein
MLYRVAADLLVLIHFIFVLFVLAGGFLGVRWRWVPFIHLPCAVWGALIEFRGWICPLTPWENALRRLAGEAGYAGGFIEHYLIRILYPPGLTPGIQITLGTTVVVINGFAYWLYIRTRRRAA